MYINYKQITIEGSERGDFEHKLDYFIFPSHEVVYLYNKKNQNIQEQSLQSLKAINLRIP